MKISSPSESRSGRLPTRFAVRSLAYLGLLIASLTGESARAQSAYRDATLEVGLSSHTYDAGISPWRGISMSTGFLTGDRNTWRIDAVVEERFSEPSFAYRASHTWDGNALFVRSALHTSTGGFYNARFRADAQVGFKVLTDRSLVLLGGAFHRAGRDGHRDSGASFELQRYFANRWIVQAGVRRQLSTPGAAWSTHFDAAITWGANRLRYVTLHAHAGQEAYEVIDPLTIYVDFESKGARLSLREWTGRNSGFTVAASWYSNPYYRRFGFEAGLFIGLGS